MKMLPDSIDGAIVRVFQISMPTIIPKFYKCNEIEWLTSSEEKIQFVLWHREKISFAFIILWLIQVLAFHSRGFSALHCRVEINYKA